MKKDDALDLVNDAQAGVLAASGEMENQLATRRWAFQRALDAGATQAEIARTTGLTRARVNQIVTEEARP